MRLLKRGIKGTDVIDIQFYLDDLGYKIQPSGIYDTNTILCVKGFQDHINKDFDANPKLKVDGIVGDKTRTYIKKFNRNNYCPEVYEPILNNPEDLDCYGLEKYILDRGLAGLSWAFVDSQNNYKVNILHNIAHAVLESASGTSFIARMKNNLYGFKAYDSSPYVSAGKFQSYSICIMEWTKWLLDNYLWEDGKYFNGNNEKGIAVRYCTSPVAGINKAFIVRDFKKSMAYE